MKHIQSTTENNWVEIKEVVFSPEDLVLLDSDLDTDMDAKRILFDRVKAEKEVEASPEDVILAQSLYDSIKPELKETDTYLLISADFFIGDTQKGILNCRINGEHEQVRA